VAQLAAWIHEPERGGEDDAVAGLGELVDDALGVRALLDALDIAGLDLVAERGVDRLAPDVMLERPAEIGDRPDIDEAGLEGVGGGGNATAAENGGAGDGGAEHLVEASPTCEHVCLLLFVLQMARLADHPAAWNGRPRQAGALSRMRVLSREISTRTTTVAR
jgi:hypothetical protein